MVIDLYLNEYVRLWFQVKTLEKAAFRMKTSLSQGWVQGFFCKPIRSVRAILGLGDRLTNPSVQGESSPPWLLLALTH